MSIQIPFDLNMNVWRRNGKQKITTTSAAISNNEQQLDFSIERVYMVYHVWIEIDFNHSNQNRIASDDVSVFSPLAIQLQIHRITTTVANQCDMKQKYSNNNNNKKPQPHNRTKHCIRSDDRAIWHSERRKFNC